MITGDPRAFGAAPVMSSGSTPSPASDGRSRVWIMVGAVVVVALIVALVWPRSTHHPLATTTTTTSAIDTPPSSTAASGLARTPFATERPFDPLPGRPAPTPLNGSGIGLRLSVFPLQVPFGTPVSVRLEGDLSKVGPTLAALVWVDRSVDNGWQTAAWVAQTAPGFQEIENVTTRDAGPSPDAITIPTGDEFGVNLDGLAAGTYRVCRYVPLAVTEVTAADGSLPIDNPVYLCAPITLT
jgi:hypothetical protein